MIQKTYQVKNLLLLISRTKNENVKNSADMLKMLRMDFHETVLTIRLCDNKKFNFELE